MLTKEDHIKYWISTAKKDLVAVLGMYKVGIHIQALFFAHLHLEKLCKALWVQNNVGNTPPRIHNLVKILNEAKVEYSEDQMNFMILMNSFQLEGRYPDYLQKLYKAYKHKNTGEVLSQVKIFSKWLQGQLLQK